MDHDDPIKVTVTGGESLRSVLAMLEELGRRLAAVYPRDVLVKADERD